MSAGTAACLAVIMALQCSANTVRREARASHWERVTRSVMDITTDEHALEMALTGTAPAAQEQDVTRLRLAVFSLVDASATRNTPKTVQAVRRILACCSSLKRATAPCPLIKT